MPDQTALVSHYYLKLAGQDPRAELLESITEVSVESSLHMPDVATIVLLDPETKWADSDEILPGKEIAISARTESREQPLFDGEIVEIELAWEQGLQKVIVRAFDRLHRLARGRSVRSFQNVTDGDLVTKIAQEVGLQAQVGPTTQVHPYVLQANETNLEFLQSRAAALGYLLFVEKKTLHCEAVGSQRAPIAIRWGHEVSEFRPRMSTIGQVSGVTVRGWDPAERREIMGNSQESKVVPKIGNGTSGGKLAEQAFHLSNVKYLVADRPVRAQPAAEKLAQAVADRQAGRFIEAEGLCAGTPGLVAGAQVSIDNIGKRFSGTYFVTAASHQFRPGEYTTHFTVSGLQPATLISLLAPEQPVSIPDGLVIGIVTDNQDPDGLGRVKVKYPWLSPDHASYWARVVVVGGGPDRGIEFLPEVNDEVLVGFELGDIHYPYVLGGLWNGKDKPPKKSDQVLAGGKVKERIIRSRTGYELTFQENDDGSQGLIQLKTKSGRTVTLSDTDKQIEIKTDGNTITLTDQNKAIEIKNGANTIKLDEQGRALALETSGDLKIKAAGKVTIEGTAGVEMKSSATVDIQAQAAMKLQANATLDVKSSAILSIQGSLVKIN
jgi:phage protein D